MSSCRITLDPLGGDERHAGYGDRPFRALFGNLKVEPRLPFSRSDFFREGPRLAQGISISGVQQKLSLRISDAQELVLTRTDGAFILKPSPPEYPHAAENEHCAMLTGRLLGIPTAECALVEFSDGELAYLVRRFDRTPAGKLPQEDLAQGFGLASDAKYDRSCQEALQLMRDMSGGKAAVVLDGWKRIVHAYLIGNDDLHLKNLSLQRLPGNRSHHYDRLTPNYDSLATHAFPNHSLLGALALDLLLEERDGHFSESYQRRGFYARPDFLELGRRVGLRPLPMESFLGLIESRRLGLRALVQRSFMPEAMRSRVLEILEDRMRALRSE
jgi:serine/threonine-protein kinase HipA